MLYLGIDQHAKQLTVSLRDEAGDIRLRRQVSTQPERCLEFLTKLNEKAKGEGGYVAVVEVCGFNDWLLELLGGRVIKSYVSLTIEGTGAANCPSWRKRRKPENNSRSSCRSTSLLGNTLDVALSRAFVLNEAAARR